MAERFQFAGRPTAEVDEQGERVVLRATLSASRDHLWHRLLREVDGADTYELRGSGNEVSFTVSPGADIGGALEWLTSAIETADERRRQAGDRQKELQEKTARELGHWWETYQYSAPSDSGRRGVLDLATDRPAQEGRLGGRRRR